MKAVRFRGAGELAVEICPDPVLHEGDALLEPLVAGVCGTDVHIVKGEYASRPPVVLGHEIAGRVLEIRGSGSPVRVGDLVTVDPHRYCGVCEYCRRAMEHMCQRKEAYGVHLDGGMAELMAAPTKTLFPVASDVTASVAALAEPLACCIHGMDRLAPVSGLPILIFGCGAAGAMLIALARHAGLRPVVVIDPNPAKRELALVMGADVALDSNDADLAARSLATVPTDGYPYIIDAVGSTEVLTTALAVAGRGARILVFGVAAPEASLPVHPNQIYAKELTILGSAINPFTHQRAVSLLTRLPLDALEMGFFDLDDAERALAAVRLGAHDKVQLRVKREP